MWTLIFRNLSFLLLALVPHVADAAEGALLTFYDPGETLILRLSDISDVRIEPEQATSFSSAVFKVTPKAAKRMSAFTSGLVGRSVTGIVDGKVWFSRLKVHEPLALRTIRISGFESGYLDRFTVRLRNLQRDAARRHMPFVVMFEEIDRLKISSGDIKVVSSNDSMIEVKIGALSRSRLLELISGETYGRWHLALGDYVIGSWEYEVRNEFIWLKLRDFNPGATSVARSLSLQNPDLDSE